MATEAQIAANRANAQKSTGPKSPPGKASSSQNARKHGLAGTTTAALIESESDRAFLEEQKAAWRVDFDPQGTEEEYLFEVVVAENIRTSRCRDAWFALLRDHARHAKTTWDADRRRAADELALRLGKTPQAIAHKLEETLQGAELMIELWGGLASALDRNASWTDGQRSIALDLLGVHPEFRDAETPVDPAEGDVLGTRMDIIESEITRLTSLCEEVLVEGDAHDRAMAESTLGAEFTKPVQLIDRYERAAWRRARWAWKRLDDARQSRATEPAAKPKPKPAPAAKPKPATTAVVPVAATPRPTPVTPAPAPDRPMNRHQRRAMAAQARRAAG